MSRKFHRDLVDYVKSNIDIYRQYKNAHVKILICRKCGFSRSAHSREPFSRMFPVSSDITYKEKELYLCVKCFSSGAIWYRKDQQFELDPELSQVFWTYLRLMGVLL